MDRIGFPRGYLARIYPHYVFFWLCLYVSEEQWRVHDPGETRFDAAHCPAVSTDGGCSFSFTRGVTGVIGHLGFTWYQLQRRARNVGKLEFRIPASLQGETERENHSCLRLARIQLKTAQVPCTFRRVLLGLSCRDYRVFGCFLSPPFFYRRFLAFFFFGPWVISPAVPVCK